jgi:sigma-B regulation protein RsbU (phosphoserine phosphatase)
MSSSKILIVDDEPFNVDYLAQELEELNCDTVSASNGQEALDQVTRESPDLVLLDIMMPVMDGLEVLSRLKTNPSTRDIPVIVISASSDLRSVANGIQLGAEDYLPKPFEPTLLHARISSSLEKKRLHDLEQLYLKGLERELDIARDIQKGFLPDELPRLKGWDINAYFKAAREVAGDFYDAFLLPGGNLVFVVGDVCGKGVGAALFMTLFRSLIRAACTMDVFYSEKDIQALTMQERLAKAISFTNRYIYDVHGDSSMFATVFIGAFELSNGTLAYINCGNEPALIVRNGCVLTSLRPTAPVIGIFPEANFYVKEFIMEQDDLILAFTDGIPDARNLCNESLGHQGLLNILNDALSDPALLLRQIEERLRCFVGTAEQFDDITLMAVRKNT